MAMYHISSDGEARPCRATKASCPLTAAGAQHANFDSIEDARAWAEQEMAIENAGSFGVLAKQLAEQDIEKREALRAAALAATAADARFARIAALDEIHGLFNADYIESLRHENRFKRRKASKRFDSLAETLGLPASTPLSTLYSTYVDEYDFPTGTSTDRFVVRNRIVTGKMLRQIEAGSGRRAHLDRSIERLEALLSSVPNEDKDELNLGPYSVGPKADLEAMDNDKLTRELADADARERYFAEWADTAKIRLINYGASAGRQNVRERLFGGEYDRIVTRGPSTGFTADEAKYFENVQAVRWTAYHAALKAEAVRRLAPQPAFSSVQNNF